MSNKSLLTYVVMTTLALLLLGGAACSGTTSLKVGWAWLTQALEISYEPDHDIDHASIVINVTFFSRLYPL